MDTFARACMHGLPAWRFATTEDKAVELLIGAATDRAVRFARERDEDLATLIANRLH